MAELVPVRPARAVARAEGASVDRLRQTRALESDSTIALVRDAIDQTLDLAHTEVALAKLDVVGYGERVASGAPLVAGGVVLLGSGCVAMVCSAVALLTTWLPLWSALAVVGGTCIASGAVAVARGRRRMAATRTDT